MSVVLGEAFDSWWRRFDGGGVALAHWETPVILGDMADAQQVHLAGLNLSRVPAVFIECANMRNATDAAKVSSAAWRQQAAAGIVAGITAFLHR